MKHLHHLLPRCWGWGRAGTQELGR